MQVLTNERLVRNRGRLGLLASFAGFGCLVGGLVVSWWHQEWSLFAWAALLPGYLLIMYGSHNTIRWGTKPRVDQILARELKTLDHKYQLFNYVDGLPVDNLLLTPGGLVALEVRPYLGDFVNTGSRWRRRRNLMGWLMAMGEGGLGNPTRDAQRDVTAVRQYLTEQLGDEMAERVPVESVVVFTHPRAELTVEQPDVPVVAARDLKPAVRRPQGRAKLPGDVYTRVAQALRPADGK